MLKKKVSECFQNRRSQLMKLDSTACFIFFSADELIRSNDSHFPFRQSSNFHYLTDFDEPGAALVLVNGESHLFVQERDESREIWNGERYGADRASGVFGTDEAYSMQEFFNKLPDLLKGAAKVYYQLGDIAERDQKILRAIRESIPGRGKGSLGNLPVYDPMPHVAELRIVKDAGELELIRKACSVSARAHTHILKTTRAGMNEFELTTELQYFMQKNGLREWGYTPIVASGMNATTLHYIRNNDVLKEGDLVLVDAGGENELYSADITQTFPVGKKFSEQQKKVYEKVLEVNRAITGMAKPGISYRSLHTEAVAMISDALKSLGVPLPEKESYRKYFPHGLGHYLGLDVHDVGIYQEHGKDFLLKPGMIMTNEPGLYFRGIETAYHGIGIRIEDDLLITDTGCENLTRELPRGVDEIESLRS